MKHAVWKYTLNAPIVTLLLPAGAEVLHFGVQNQLACIWVRVRPELVTSTERHFEVVGTGEPFDATGRRYIGTAMTEGGEFVWHLFEVTR